MAEAVTEIVLYCCRLLLSVMMTLGRVRGDCRLFSSYGSQNKGDVCIQTVLSVGVPQSIPHRVFRARIVVEVAELRSPIVSTIHCVYRSTSAPIY